MRWCLKADFSHLGITGVALGSANGTVNDFSSRSAAPENNLPLASTI